MNDLEVMAKLISKMADGTNKQNLLAKLNKLKEKSSGKGGNGLEDKFELEATGHILIEKIDKDGNPVGVLQDKDNLVVNGSETIALKALAGDANRILYKNRTIKPNDKGVVNNVTVYLDEKLLNGQPIMDAKTILHSPNVLWRGIDESLFNLEYAYFPNQLYIKPEISNEPGKVAFSLSETYTADRLPLTAEVYSTYTNMFIGLGDGENAPIQLDDKRLVVTGDPAAVQNASEISSKVLNTAVSFKGKMTNFSVTLEKSNKGPKKVKISVDTVEKAVVDLYDALAETPTTETIKIKDISDAAESTVKIEYLENDVAVSEGLFKITRFACDTLDKNMNSLMAEFKNKETHFLTPTPYNTESTAPYTVQLPHHDIIKETLVVEYDGEKMTLAESKEAVADKTYFIDTINGIVYFNRVLSNVLMSYNITGRVFDRESAKTMLAGTNTVEVVKDETAVVDGTVKESPDGINKVFSLVYKDLKEGTLTIKVDDVPLEPQDITSIDLAAGTFELSVAPETLKSIKCSYTYYKPRNVSHETLIYKLANNVDSEDIYLADQSGEVYKYVADKAQVYKGCFTIDPTNKKQLIIGKRNSKDELMKDVVCLYVNNDNIGVDTNYRRAIIQKPKVGNEYPWYNLDKGSIQFVAEFPEEAIKQNVTIREMGLFDGPRPDDKIRGSYNVPVQAFSLVRSGETLKDVNTGIRVTWTITLKGEGGKVFKG